MLISFLTIRKSTYWGRQPLSLLGTFRDRIHRANLSFQHSPRVRLASIRGTSTRLSRRKRNETDAEFGPDRMLCHGSIEPAFGMAEGQPAVRMTRMRIRKLAGGLACQTKVRHVPAHAATGCFAVLWRERHSHSDLLNRVEAVSKFWSTEINTRGPEMIA